MREPAEADLKAKKELTRTYPSILDDLGRGSPTGMVSIGGGCIADAAVATFDDGSEVFVKRASVAPGMFECEAEGLRALAATGTIRVPQVLAVGDGALVLEMIREAPRISDFFESFGRAFARLHDCRGQALGFPHDNFIGSTPQHNDPVGGSWRDVTLGDGAGEDGSSWPEFFVERRLRFQAELVSRHGHGNELELLLGRAETRIAELLATAPETPSILHGDLWGGNFITDDAGEACLIDPAVYYGHREADLAMTRLFGGFAPPFYEAYQETLPLAAGHEDRLAIYQLYHVMNHLNLFGGGYYAQSKRILQRYAP